MRCKSCMIVTDHCDNMECINRLHDSGSFNIDYGIFCDNGSHYCEKDCLIEEFKSCGITGVDTELQEN